MKISFNWLKEFVDIEKNPAELADMLTMAGLEVEGLEHRGNGLDGILIARILDIRPHPKADRLSICRMNTGKEEVSVVCGAPNIKENDLVPLALPGTMLPDGSSIKQTHIRGEASQGMLLAEDEMSLTDDHTGIMILPGELTPGKTVSQAIELEDWVLDVSISPNRVDCASVFGVAREVSAITKKPLRTPEISFKEGKKPVQDLTDVSILDPKGCPRYTAGLVENVNLGPSPFWIRYRLHLTGVRPINNIVDATNYVMMEMGQPLHAFDYHRLEENRIVVKKAEKGQVFTTLDQEDRQLDEQTLMICDGKRPVALAGIMGGLNSEITGETNTILIESACFSPTMIRKSSKRLGLSTEASYRFERGVDIQGVEIGLKRSLALISELAGGETAAGIIDRYPEPWAPPRITLDPQKVNKTLGINIDEEEMSENLSSLRMVVNHAGDGRFEVKPPSFRVDISREADLVEEIARLKGYDNIPSTLPAIRPTQSDDSELNLRDFIKAMLVGMGFAEIITYSFISPRSADIMGAEKNSYLRSFVNLLNPLTQDQSVMRTSLIPGLVSTVKLNSFRGQEDLRIFEWGKIYIKGKEELPRENLHLIAAITGLAEKKEWYSLPREADFFDIKGVAENILEGLGLKEVKYKRQKPRPGFDPAEYARIFFSGSEIGVLGLASKEGLDEYELDKKVYILKLDIDALSPLVKWNKEFKPLPKFPSVKRDISIILDRSIESGTVINIARKTGKGLVEFVKIFDVYQGKNIPSGEKALALRISYRSGERTLTDQEVNRIHESVISEIRRHTGGRLREGPSG